LKLHLKLDFWWHEMMQILIQNMVKFPSSYFELLQKYFCIIHVTCMTNSCSYV
jgi:hypothetical protein